MSIISPNFYWFFLLFVALILFTLLIRKEKQITNFLRICSFFLLLSCIFEPIFRFSFVSRPSLLVLLDTSGSMRVGERLEKAKQILAQIKAKNLEFDIYGFNTHPYPISSSLLPTITAEDELTSIGNAILETPSPSAYLLLSDGINNFGPDPISIAIQKNIPIYTIKIPDSLAGDIRISSLIYNKIAYTKDKIPIKLRFENTGFNGQKVKILLKENNRILREKSQLLSQDSNQNEIEFSIVPEEPGVHLYEVSISELPGEINKDNNKREFGIRVLKSRVRVGWFSSAPSWNFKFARLEFAHDPKIEFEWWIKVKEGEWVSKNGISATPDFSTSYDVVILDNFDYPGVERLINKGAIIIGNACKSISPFILGSSTYESKSPIEVVEGVDIFGVKELPPLKEIYLNKGTKPGIRVLCRTHEGTPLIVRSGSTIWIAANDIWRWNFSSEFKFWSAMVKLIAFKGPALFVETEPVVEVGERVIFKASAYTQTYELSPDCDIVVKVVSLDRDSVSVIEVPLYSLGNGKYEGAIDFLPPGRYEYEATTEKGISSKGEFTVASQLEFQKLTSDSNFLRTLSSVSGGKYVEDVKDLRIELKLMKTKIPFNPSYSYFFILLIVFLLTAEWIWLRK